MILGGLLLVTRIVLISLLLVVSLFVLIIPQNSFAQGTPFTVEEAKEFLDLAAEEALLQFKDRSFEEFKRVVYKEPSLWGVYIVNGDTPIANERLLREFFDRKISGVDSSSTQSLDQSLMFSSFSHDLIIGRAGDLDTVWGSERKNALTYCVSTIFGERYDLVVASMMDAAEAWEAAADIDFIHVASEDNNCTATNLEVVFDVQPISSQPYLARAFFPDFPRAQRNILIDETSFELSLNGNLQLVGILRHELGHTLGARHEHTRPEAGSCFEDINWRGVTDYDAFSVMHYPQCNGQGDLSLTLTDLDKNGMACVYGAAPEFTVDQNICDTAVRLKVEPSIEKESLAVTDFNADGKADIAFHRPHSDGAWASTPIIFSNGDGSWREANNPSPAYVNRPSVIALPGDYDGDGKTDMAFHRPHSDGAWASTPVLFSNGNGSWREANNPSPAYVNRPSVIALPGDYDGDGKTDMAFHRPHSDGAWASTPIIFSNGDGSWREANNPSPEYINRPSVIALPGDYDGDGKTDMAFHRPHSDGAWASTPIIFSNGDGSWREANNPSPEYINRPSVIALPGDYDGDGKTDIAFHRPHSDGAWASTPIIFSNGDGSWREANNPSPAYVNRPSVIALPGDYDGDGKTDMAFHRPHSENAWGTTPVLFSNGDGSWRESNSLSPGYINQTGVVALPDDYDGDGKTDMAFHRPHSENAWGTTPVLFSNGDGSWRESNSLSPGYINQTGVVAFGSY